MTLDLLKKVYNWFSDLVLKIGWPLFLLCLPVTSFPFFPKTFGGSALVRPLSLFPLLILLPIIVLPRLLFRPVPRTLYGLLPFSLVALASSLLSTQQGIESTFGVTVNDRIARALITLIIGGAIYASVTLVPRSPEQLRSSLRWLYAGFTIALLWGSIQAVYVVHFDPQYYKLLSKIQAYISTRDLFTTRISGLTYEPNWFGMQIIQLLIPWLLASVIQGYTIFPQRWKFLTVELLLLLWSTAILIFTFSRAGIAVLIFLTFFAMLVVRPARRVEARAERRKHPWLRHIIEAGIGVIVVIGMVYVASARSPFFARLWDYWQENKKASFGDYIEYVGFAARFTYGETALNIYSANPVLGIGLGNYAFYFPKMMPDRPLVAAPELLRIINPDDSRDRLITPKNFFLRILAETGLVGAAAFSAFLVGVLGCALFLFTAPQAEVRFWGASSLLGLASFGASSLSFDSFAIPNTWVVFGLITAAAWVYYQPSASENSRQ